MSFARDPELARRAAAIRYRCGWCELELRPCNLARHIRAHHFRQLTIDEILDMPPRGFGHYPDEWQMLTDKDPELHDRVVAETEAEVLERRQLEAEEYGAVFPDADQEARWQEMHTEEDF